MTSEQMYDTGMQTQCFPAIGGPLNGKIIRAPSWSLIYLLPRQQTHVYSFIPGEHAWVYCQRFVPR